MRGSEQLCVQGFCGPALVDLKTFLEVAKSTSIALVLCSTTSFTDFFAVLRFLQSNKHGLNFQYF